MMESSAMDVMILFLIVPPLLLIEGFFSGSEIALLSADKLGLKSKARQGSKSAKLALELSNHPERVLASTLLMTSVCVVATSSLLSLYFMSLGIEHSEFFAILVTSPLVVIVGELIPKTIFQRFSDRMAPWVAMPVNLVYWAFFPVTRVLSGYTTRLSRLLGPVEELIAGKRRTKREELETLLSYGKKDSELKSSERRMIKRIFDFKDTEAKHALIPLVRVDAIDQDSTIGEAFDKFRQHRHSRMPVFSGRVDNIVGVLELGDLTGATDRKQSIKPFLTPAHYVAETQALSDLLQDLRREDIELVVVVDEYGGAIGIITLEDIIEEIVGDIQDEYDAEHLPYRELTPSSWLVQARMEITAIQERLAIEIPEGEYETLAGFLLQQFGRIPEVGDELYYDTRQGTVKFTIRKASERQIESVHLERLETSKS